MDDLIHQLLQVDKQARQRVAKAKKQRAGALEALENGKQEIRAKNEEAFAAFVESETARTDASRDAQIQEIDAQFDGVIDRLDAACRDNLDAWAAQIAASVTKA